MSGGGFENEPAGGEPLKEPGEISAIDDLFGETRFLEYDHRLVSTETPLVSRKAKEQKPETAPRAPRGAQGGLPRLQRVLLWIAGGLLAALALVGLFALGTKLPAVLGPAPAIVATDTPTPTPTPTDAAEPVGPVAPGEYEWDELLGGECLDPYQGPWAEDFTVVDCAQPHPAQLVARGEFPDGDVPFPPYPGLEAMQSQINLLCTAPTVIDYAAAGKYLDVQFEASYPATQEEWAAGHRDYFCFVSRSSGEPITGSIAVPPPAPTTPPAP